MADSSFVRDSKDSIIAIGDVHGCAAELARLLQKLKLTPESQVVFVGDLIDRGPDSRGVVELVMELSTFCRVTCLLGNHEDMLLGFLGSEGRADLSFLFNGGGTTLASYADDAGRYDIPKADLDFFRNMPLVHQTEDFFFVHAGVPEVPLASINPTANRQDLLWSRSIIDSQYRWSKLVVHGHTYRKRTELLANRINLDTGCVFGNRLSAVVLPSRKVVSVRASDGIAAARLLRDSASRRRAIRFAGKARVRVRHRDGTLEFETANYSQVGMLIRKVSSNGQPPGVGEVIEGTIGEGYGALDFSGVVTRHVSNEDGEFYGARFILQRPAY